GGGEARLVLVESVDQLEAGIEIMSPHYMAVRDGNESTTPKEYQKSNNPSNKAGEESKPE
ncbi:MAG: hypothetical protein ACK5LF_02260, partial [Bacteroides xylanisolvens]